MKHVLAMAGLLALALLMERPIAPAARPSALAKPFTGMPCNPPGTAGAPTVYAQLPDKTCLPLVAIPPPGLRVESLTASFVESSMVGKPVVHYQYFFVTLRPVP